MTDAYALKINQAIELVNNFIDRSCPTPNIDEVLALDVVLEAAWRYAETLE